MNDQQWESVREIFDDRGVSREVAEARPYQPFKRGAEWVYADEGPYAVVPIEQRRSTVMLDVRGADGLVMYKHPVPLSEHKLPEFPPQLRPTPNPITGKIVNHDHADPWITNLEEHVEKRHPEGDVEGVHDNYRQERHDHAEEYVEGSLARDEHVRGRAHHGRDVVGQHPNGEPGKYKIPPSRLTTTHTIHAHPLSATHCKHRPKCASDEEHTARHAWKYHVRPKNRVERDPARVEEMLRGGRVSVRDPSEVPDHGVPHPHPWRVTDRHSDSYGQRIDAHPWAADRLADAEVVQFSLEGNLKADAMLTYILEHGLPWSVVDAPSVGQWRAPELDDFAAEHLRDCRVFLVCDSDWIDRPDVARQAFAFREYLRRTLGKHAVQVAAPPESPDEFEDCSERHGPDCPNPERKKIGVDDWVGKYRGRLEELVVVERDFAPAMREWAEVYPVRYVKPGPNPLKKEAYLVRLMSLLANPDGRGRSSEKSLASFTGLHRDTVRAILGRLEEQQGSYLSYFLLAGVAREGFGVELPEVERFEPFDLLKRRPPKGGYRGSEERDQTVEWAIRDGFRWTERTPRRTLEQLLG